MGFLDGGFSALFSPISSLVNLFTANNTAKKQAAMNRENIQATKDINAANIANQQLINQQNIDFQREINDLMRQDSNTAISRRKDDLIRAGYSTADPNLQGFGTASLGSPSLQMAQQSAPLNDIQSLLGAENLKQQAINNFSSSILDSAGNMADVALKRAEAKKADKESSKLEKEVTWYDAETFARIQNFNAQTKQSLSAAGVNEATINRINQEMFNMQIEANKMRSEIALLKETKDLTKEQRQHQKYMNEFIEYFSPYFPEYCDKKIKELDSIINKNNSSASADLINASANLMNAKTGRMLARSQVAVNQSLIVLNDAKAEFQKLDTYFARMGLSTHASNWLQSIINMVSAPDAAQHVDIILNNITSMFGELGKAIGDAIF